MLEWIYMEPGVCQWNNVTRKLIQNVYTNQLLSQVMTLCIVWKDNERTLEVPFI